MLWGCLSHLSHSLEVAIGQLAIYRMVWQPLKHFKYLGYGFCVRAKLKRWLVLLRGKTGCRREIIDVVLKGWILKMSLEKFHNFGENQS